MKKTDEIAPYIEFDLATVEKKLEESKSLHNKLNKLAREESLLDIKRKELNDYLIKDINTYKSILYKFERNYLIFIHYELNNLKTISLLDFTPVYNINYDFEQYVNKHFEKSEFTELQQYNSSSFFIGDNNSILNFKPVFKKEGRRIKFTMRDTIKAITSDAYFINKEEFNKIYELVD